MKYRVETCSDKRSYLVEDGGDRSKPITSCVSRMATEAEIMLWEHLELADKKIATLNEQLKSSADRVAAQSETLGRSAEKERKKQHAA